MSGNATIIELLGETASLAVSALNGTGGSLTSGILESVKRKGTSGSLVTSVNDNAFEVLRSVMEKRQFRIPCLGVVVRL